MEKNPPAFVQVDTKNRAGLMQSLGALVGAAALPVADKQKLLTLGQAQQGSNSEDEEKGLGAPAAATCNSCKCGTEDSILILI